MNKERLLDVVAVLRDVPDDDFDIVGWHCGTTACAVGHYILNRPECGLRFSRDIPVCMDEGWPRFGFGAVAAHFDIEIEDAYHLFDSHGYPLNPLREDVIRRIEDFVAGGGAA